MPLPLFLTSIYSYENTQWKCSFALFCDIDHCRLEFIESWQVQRATWYAMFFALFFQFSYSGQLETKSLLIIISDIHGSNANSNCYNCLINFYCLCYSNIMAEL